MRRIRFTTLVRIRRQRRTSSRAPSARTSRVASTLRLLFSFLSVCSLSSLFDVDSSSVYPTISPLFCVIERCSPRSLAISASRTQTRRWSMPSRSAPIATRTRHVLVLVAIRFDWSCFVVDCMLTVKRRRNTTTLQLRHSCPVARVCGTAPESCKKQKTYSDFAYYSFAIRNNKQQQQQRRRNRHVSEVDRSALHAEQRLRHQHLLARYVLLTATRDVSRLRFRNDCLFVCRLATYHNNHDFVAACEHRQANVARSRAPCASCATTPVTTFQHRDRASMR